MSSWVHQSTCTTWPPVSKGMGVTGRSSSHCGKSGHLASGWWCKYLDYRSCGWAGHKRSAWGKRKVTVKKKQQKIKRNEKAGTRAGRTQWARRWRFRCAACFNHLTRSWPKLGTNTVLGSVLFKVLRVVHNLLEHKKKSTMLPLYII